MRIVALPAAVVLASSLALGCGSAPVEPPASPEPVAAAPAAPEAAPPSTAPEAAAAEPAPSAEPAAEPAKEAVATEPESMTLARELVKTGGRRIGWSAKKKGFVVPQSARAGDVASLDIVFTDDDGRKRDVMRVCQPGECEEHLKEKAKELLPKLAARLEADEYTSVRATGWPSRDELELPSLGFKLRLDKGKLQAVREGKPAKPLGTVKPAKLLAIYLVPDAKLVGLFSSEDGQEENQVFSVLKLP